MGSSGGKRRPEKTIVVDADGGRRTIKPRARLSRVVSLAQRRDVVEDPEGAPVGGDDEIVAVDGEIVHRD